MQTQVSVSVSSTNLNDSKTKTILFLFNISLLKDGSFKAPVYLEAIKTRLISYMSELITAKTEPTEWLFGGFELLDPILAADYLRAIKVQDIFETPGIKENLPKKGDNAFVTLQRGALKNRIEEVYEPLIDMLEQLAHNDDFNFMALELGDIFPPQFDTPVAESKVIDLTNHIETSYNEAPVETEETTEVKNTEVDIEIAEPEVITTEEENVVLNSEDLQEEVSIQTDEESTEESTEELTEELTQNPNEEIPSEEDVAESVETEQVETVETVDAKIVKMELKPLTELAPATVEAVNTTNSVPVVEEAPKQQATPISDKQFFEKLAKNFGVDNVALATTRATKAVAKNVVSIRDLNAKKKGKTSDKQQFDAHNGYYIPRAIRTDIGKVYPTFPTSYPVITAKAEENRLASLKADATRDKKAAKLLEHFENCTGRISSGSFVVVTASLDVRTTRRHMGNFHEGFNIPFETITGSHAGRIYSVNMPNICFMEVFENKKDKNIGSRIPNAEMAQDLGITTPVIVSPFDMAKQQEMFAKVAARKGAFLGTWRDVRSNLTWLVFYDSTTRVVKLPL